MQKLAIMQLFLQDHAQPVHNSGLPGRRLVGTLGRDAARRASIYWFLRGNSGSKTKAPGGQSKAPGAIRRNHFANYSIE
jgi:hypothetical protein